MRISGLQKVTLLDYPSHIACTVFLARCNLRCPFCHNMDLVEKPEMYEEIKIDTLLDYLKSRVGKLTGVAITGGEPLLNQDIEILLKRIKELNYPIKLDTNGFFSEMLKKVLDEKLIDMVAMDIKSGFKNYMRVTGILNSNIDENEVIKKVSDSISIIMNSKIEYEFRTTCVKGLHTIDDFYEIREMIKGAKKYFLQDYKAHDEMVNLPFKPFTRTELENFACIVKDNVESVSIRGID